MPDDSGFAIALGLVLDVGQTVAGGGFLSAGLGLGGAQGGGDRGVDGVVLVVGGEFFGGGEGDEVGLGVFFFGFFKDDEVAQEIEQGGFVQHALGDVRLLVESAGWVFW
ncbi:MAG: hypothetical protein RLZZ511_3529 [Cyanobacteriota bacterium]